jgi:ribosomal protein S18 acetylase RimI-like enzyme
VWVEQSLNQLLERIEEASRKLGAKNRNVIAVGSFWALIDPVSELTWLNYAVPVEPLGTSSQVADLIVELREVFAQSDRTLRFELIESRCPTLPKILEEAGLNMEARHPMLLCTPADFQPYYAAGVEVKLLDADDPEVLLSYLAVRNRSFYGLAADEMPTAEEIIELCQDIENGSSRCALAYFNGIPAGVGVTMPMMGVCELAGVATLPEHRRLGVAKSLCSFLIKDHFETGGDLVWLAAGNAIAKSTYESIGFRCVDSRLNYIDAIVINSKTLSERFL